MEISTISTPNLAQTIIDRKNCKPLMDAFDNFKKLVKDIPDYETRSKFLSAGFEIMIAAKENAFDKTAAYQLAILADDI